jgi:aminopeptidase N
MYPKGANMLHTLRQIVNDDEKWRTILRGLNSTFYHQTVTTKQIEDYLSKNVGLDLAPFFDQYLRDIRIPTFEYKFKDNNLSYRWANCVADFNMPLKVMINGKEQWLKPQVEWSDLPKIDKNTKLEVDNNFYVNVLKSKE